MPATVRELDLLTYREKIKHWNREDDPWRPPSGSYRFNSKLPEDFRVQLSGGNIVNMPLVVGRPCHGIITAFFRYKDSIKYVKGRGQQPASRCFECRYRSSCERIVRRRIAATPTVRDAFDHWLKAEGPSLIDKAGWRQRDVGRKWAALVRAALASPFESCNDVALSGHYEWQDQIARDKDRIRQQRNRRQLLTAGSLDDEHRKDLSKAAVWRIKRLADAVRAARTQKAPLTLSKLTATSVRDLHNVWVGRETLRAQKQKCSGHAIARWLVDNQLADGNRTPAALATRVNRDLRRIAQLQIMPWEGGFILPTFDPRTEFSH